MREPEGGLLRRDDLLSGRLHRDRRAVRLAGLIETRVVYMRAESRRAITAYFLDGGDGAAAFTRRSDRDLLQSIKASVRDAYHLRAADLERYAPQWAPLVPGDAEARAALLRVLALRVPLNPDASPGTLAALGAGDPAVQAAYKEAHEQPVESLFNAAPAEHLPPAAHDGAALDEAVASLAWLTLPGGMVLFRPGDPGDALYIVISGRLRVTVLREGGGHETVAELGRGELVGEAEALTGEPRSMAVTAVRDSEMVRLSQAALVRLAQHHPEVMLRVGRILATRLRAQLAGPPRAADTVTTFALVPAGDPGLASALTRRLVGVLARYGPVLHLDRARVEREFGAGAPDAAHRQGDDAELAGWLSEQEQAHRFVLYEADPQISEWTRRCVRQADRILLIAAAARGPVLTPIERAIDAMGVKTRRDLLLVHPAGTHRPAGTRAWLAPRRVHDYFHLRLDDEAQLAHAARRLTGHAVGVVLSGGAARGYAHIGVMRALAEAGVPVDVIGGTSMGALLGSGFAAGHDHARMTELALGSASRGHLLDVTLPLVSFFAGRKVAELVRNQTEGARIEDLWRPFFCVSSNLTRAEPVIHREGPLWVCVRASTAIPGMFPPVLDPNGDVLVDGAMMNNLPLDVMRETVGGGTVIGVNVSPLREEVRSYRFGPSVSGWQALLGAVWPRGGAPRAPTLLSTLARANEVRGTSRMHAASFQALADLLIEPPVEQFPMLEFTRCAAIIEAGYRAARAAIQTWLAGGPDRSGW